MAKHLKPRSDKPHSDPDNDGARNQKRNITGDVHVRGEITFEPGPEEKLSRKSTETKQETKDREKKWLERITLAVVTIYAGLTAIQSCQAIKSTNIATESARTNAQQFRLDQRPYIAQTSRSSEPPTFHVNPVDGQIIWNWHMTNYGKTPANNVKFTQEIKLEGESFVPNYNGVTTDVGPPMAPSGEVFSTVISKPITKAEFDRLMSVTDGITVRIKISYTGVDGTPYETGLCLSRTNFGSLTYCKDDNYIHQTAN
jgi:hypothetical protein